MILAIAQVCEVLPEVHHVSIGIMMSVRVQQESKDECPLQKQISFCGADQPMLCHVSKGVRYALYGCNRVVVCGSGIGMIPT